MSVSESSQPAVLRLLLSENRPLFKCLIPLDNGIDLEQENICQFSEACRYADNG